MLATVAMHPFGRVCHGLQGSVHAFQYVVLGVTGTVMDVHRYVCKMLHRVDRVNVGGGVRLHITAAAVAAATAAATSVSAEKPIDSHNGHRPLNCRFNRLTSFYVKGQ